MKQIENQNFQQVQDFNSTELVRFNDINSKIITVRDNMVILDSDVAELYDVETRDINKSVKNNPDKFPKGYVFELDNKEFADLRWKFSTANLAKTRVLPKAFTEKGLYMLATILKSKKAIDATIDIIETFAKLRELSREVAEIVEMPTDENKQKAIAQKTGEILSDIVTRDLKTTGTETTFELNVLTAIKVKHTIKRERTAI